MIYSVEITNKQQYPRVQFVRRSGTAPVEVIVHLEDTEYPMDCTLQQRALLTQMFREERGHES